MPENTIRETSSSQKANWKSLGTERAKKQVTRWFKRNKTGDTDRLENMINK
jgi:hypothetical protein